MDRSARRGLLQSGCRAASARGFHRLPSRLARFASAGFFIAFSKERFYYILFSAFVNGEVFPYSLKMCRKRRLCEVDILRDWAQHCRQPQRGASSFFPAGFPVTTDRPVRTQMPPLWSHFPQPMQWDGPRRKDSRYPWSTAIPSNRIMIKTNGSMCSTSFFCIILQWKRKSSCIRNTGTAREKISLAF